MIRNSPQPRPPRPLTPALVPLGHPLGRGRLAGAVVPASYDAREKCFGFANSPSAGLILVYNVLSISVARALHCLRKVVS